MSRLAGALLLALNVTFTPLPPSAQAAVPPEDARAVREVIEAQLVQPVRLTDAESRAWIALYPMQRQPDGGWRTNGCQLGRLAATRI